MTSFIKRCFCIGKHESRSIDSFTDATWVNVLSKRSRATEASCSEACSLTQRNNRSRLYDIDAKVLHWRLEAAEAEAEANRLVAEAALVRESAALSKIKRLEQQLEVTRRERAMAVALAAGYDARLLASVTSRNGSITVTMRDKVAQREERPEQAATLPSTHTGAAKDPSATVKPEGPTAALQQATQVGTASAQPMPQPHQQRPQQRPVVPRLALEKCTSEPAPWSGGAFASVSFRAAAQSAEEEEAREPLRESPSDSASTASASAALSVAHSALVTSLSAPSDLVIPDPSTGPVKVEAGDSGALSCVPVSPPPPERSSH